MKFGPKVLQAPMAVTSAGELLVNAAYALGLGDAREVLDLLGPGAKVFLGVVVSGSTRTKALRRIDDAAAEIAGTIGDRLDQRRRRPRRRIRRSTVS